MIKLLKNCTSPLEYGWKFNSIFNLTIIDSLSFRFILTGTFLQQYIL
jgi:hypothetical protein